MATNTLSQIVSNLNIFSVLASGVVAAIVALSGQYYFFRKNQEEKRYQKLYGPLTYHLLRMMLLTNNREQLTKEIRGEFNDSNLRVTELQTHGRPLVSKWIKHKDNIAKLFEKYPGYIKKEDLKLVEGFMDGCIKREITEDGKNRYTSEERVDQLLKAIKKLQEKFLL